MSLTIDLQDVQMSLKTFTIEPELRGPIFHDTKRQAKTLGRMEVNLMHGGF